MFCANCMGNGHKSPRTYKLQGHNPPEKKPPGKNLWIAKRLQTLIIKETVMVMQRFLPLMFGVGWGGGFVLPKPQTGGFCTEGLFSGGLCTGAYGNLYSPSHGSICQGVLCHTNTNEISNIVYFVSHLYRSLMTCRLSLYALIDKLLKIFILVQTRGKETKLRKNKEYA